MACSTHQSMCIPPDAVPRPGTALIAHADVGMRSQLRTVLNCEGYTVQTFACVEALLDAPVAEGQSCVVADAGLPSRDNLALVELLKDRGPAIPIVFVSDYADVPLSVRAIKAGAIDFLPRPLSSHHLLGAVALALELDGKRRAVAHRKLAVARRFGTLTARERQVMEGVVRGLMNKQIAWELEISEITVKLHRSSLMRKLDLRSVPDLVRVSIALGA